MIAKENITLPATNLNEFSLIHKHKKRGEEHSRGSLTFYDKGLMFL